MHWKIVRLHFSVEFANKVLRVYELKCKPLCQEIGLTQTEFDILMFLYNNPKYDTATDIVNIRGIKSSLVSMNIDKLVKEGYLERNTIDNDRRKTKLIVTDKTKSIGKKGAKMQKDFFDTLFNNISEENRNIFHETMEQVKENINIIMKEKR